jgi:hypothetical protein
MKNENRNSLGPLSFLTYPFAVTAVLGVSTLLFMVLTYLRVR